MKPQDVVSETQLPQHVLRAIEKGRKIEAIKLLRESTGLGLANAKVLVDRAARRYADTNPQPVPAESANGLPRLLGSLLVAMLVFAIYRHFLHG